MDLIQEFAHRSKQQGNAEVTAAQLAQHGLHVSKNFTWQASATSTLTRTKSIHSTNGLTVTGLLTRSGTVQGAQSA